MRTHLLASRTERCDLNINIINDFANRQMNDDAQGF